MLNSRATGVMPAQPPAKCRRLSANALAVLASQRFGNSLLDKLPQLAQVGPGVGRRGLYRGMPEQRLCGGQRHLVIDHQRARVGVAPMWLGR